MSGYAIVHLLRSNFFFHRDSAAEAQALELFGGPIYDGTFTPNSPVLRQRMPTLSEDIASHLPNSMLGVCIISMGLAGAGVAGVVGGALAFLFNGHEGRKRLAIVWHSPETTALKKNWKHFCSGHKTH